MRPIERIHSLPCLPARDSDAHKGDFGKVLLIAGQRGMAGAAVLAARAALRSGSGLVTIGAPDEIIDVFPAAVPEATTWSIDEALEWSESDWRSKLEGFDAVGIGPGLGADNSCQKLVRLVLDATAAKIPHVVDADALNCVALSKGRPRPSTLRIWTPHPGEFQRLTGVLPDGDSARRNDGLKFAKDRGGVLLLKGRHSLVIEERRVYLNLTGNPGMATGGSGDVLTGICVSLLGQGLPPFDAARLAAHLHGSAGDLAARELGFDSLLAGDIIEALPSALTRFRRQTGG